MSQVYFIGAGPGDPDLITVKGRDLIARADLVLYAGSLVPEQVIVCARADAKVANSASMDLEETHAAVMETVCAGGTVARVHTGDPSLYGAVMEQAALLDEAGISWEVIPGVTAGFAAAAAAGRSFTIPEVTQTLIFSRLEGRTPVPEREHLRELARSRSAMCIYLSAGDAQGVQDALLEGGMPEDTLVVEAYRVGWSDQSVRETTLAELAKTAEENGFTRQTVFLILPGQGVQADNAGKSLLYDSGFSHMFRK